MKQCLYDIANNLLKSYNFINNSEVPVFAALFSSDGVIQTAYNKDNLHAEYILINNNSYVGSDLSMVVNLEPCPSCAFHILKSNIKYLFFGAYNTRYGALGGKFSLHKSITNKCLIFGGIQPYNHSYLIKSFFKNIRKL